MILLEAAGTGGCYVLTYYAGRMSTDEEKDPPIPADVEGKIPKKTHANPDTEQEKDGIEPADS